MIFFDQIVAKSKVIDAFAATQHQITKRARNELCGFLDNHHIDIAQAPHADVLSCGGASVATADNHHTANAVAAFLRA